MTTYRVMTRVLDRWWTDDDWLVQAFDAPHALDVAVREMGFADYAEYRRAGRGMLIVLEERRPDFDDGWDWQEWTDGRCVVCGSPTDRGDSACGACMAEATAVGERYEEVDL